MSKQNKSDKSEVGIPKVQNAFDAFFSERIKGEESPKEESKILDKQALRDTRITKVCANCGKDYHPIKNGYSQVSKYCSQKCTMNSVRGKFSMK